MCPLLKMRNLKQSFYSFLFQKETIWLSQDQINPDTLLALGLHRSSFIWSPVSGVVSRLLSVGAAWTSC